MIRNDLSLLAVVCHFCDVAGARWHYRSRRMTSVLCLMEACASCGPVALIPFMLSLWKPTLEGSGATVGSTLHCKLQYLNLDLFALVLSRPLLAWNFQHHFSHLSLQTSTEDRSDCCSVAVRFDSHPNQKEWYGMVISYNECISIISYIYWFYCCWLSPHQCYSLGILIFEPLAIFPFSWNLANLAQTVSC